MKVHPLVIMNVLSKFLVYRLKFWHNVGATGKRWEAATNVKKYSFSGTMNMHTAISFLDTLFCFKCLLMRNFNHSEKLQIQSNRNIFIILSTISATVWLRLWKINSGMVRSRQKQQVNWFNKKVAFNCKCTTPTSTPWLSTSRHEGPTVSCIALVRNSAVWNCPI